MIDDQRYRPEVLKHGPMHYAPMNELGVVFLFAHLANRWRLTIDQIRPAFPDCIAYQKVGGRERRVRIEFEFRSRNFRGRHLAHKCDWIVCWEHNWASVPKHIRIIELRKLFGLGFNVWVVPVREPFKEVLSRITRDTEWSAPPSASVGDLLLIYRTRPDQCIRDVFVLTSPVRYVKAGYRAGMDYMASARRVCALKAPLLLSDLRRNPSLGSAGFVRRSMIGRARATAYWPELYDGIVTRNPALKGNLRKYAPEHLP